MLVAIQLTITVNVPVWCLYCSDLWVYMYLSINQDLNLIIFLIIEYLMNLRDPIIKTFPITQVDSQ